MILYHSWYRYCSKGLHGERFSSHLCQLIQWHLSKACTTAIEEISLDTSKLSKYYLFTRANVFWAAMLDHLRDLLCMVITASMEFAWQVPSGTSCSRFDWIFSGCRRVQHCEQTTAKHREWAMKKVIKSHAGLAAKTHKTATFLEIWHGLKTKKQGLVLNPLRFIDIYWIIMASLLVAFRQALKCAHARSCLHDVPLQSLMQHLNLLRCWICVVQTQTLVSVWYIAADSVQMPQDYKPWSTKSPQPLLDPSLLPVSLWGQRPSLLPVSPWGQGAALVF